MTSPTPVKPLPPADPPPTSDVPRPHLFPRQWRPSNPPFISDVSSALRPLPLLGTSLGIPTPAAPLPRPPRTSLPATRQPNMAAPLRRFGRRNFLNRPDAPEPTCRPRWRKWPRDPRPPLGITSGWEENYSAQHAPRRQALVGGGRTPARGVLGGEARMRRGCSRTWLGFRCSSAGAAFGTWRFCCTCAHARLRNSVTPATCAGVLTRFTLGVQPKKKGGRGACEKILGCRSFVGGGNTA